jgi:serine/threonine-protein kinase
LSQARVVKNIAQILEAVEAAHRLQIVHRDLKPSNIILIERDGDPDYVKVCDFGLAKAIEPEETSAPSDGAVVQDSPTIGTGTGEICGTPEYMSPEQARGEPLDARSDLYAIGVMLFYALLGQLPFRARSSLAVVSLHLTAAPPRPSVLRPDLDIFPPLENLILRALAKDRAERPSSAGVLRADLLQLQRDATRRGDARAAGPASMTSEPGDTVPFTRATPQAAGALRGKRSRLRVGLGLLLAASTIAWLGRHALLDSRQRAGDVARSDSAHATVAERPPVAPAPSTTERPLAASPTGIDATTLPQATPASATAAASSAAAASARVARRSSATGVSSPRSHESSTQATGNSALRAADELLARGLIADACAAAQSAANRQPAYAPAWKFLGQCYMRLGDRARASASYRHYLDLTPDGPDAIFVREMLQDSGP